MGNCSSVLSKNDSTNVCEGIISIDQDIGDTLFVYYELNNFYQNHRRYIKSKSGAQLTG